MKELGKAKLYSELHPSGARIKGWDLSAFGGPKVFLGPATQPLPEGTVDRGPLRLETHTGRVFALEAGDPGPSIGTPGFAGTGAFGALAKYAPFLAAAAAWWFLRRKKRRR